MSCSTKSLVTGCVQECPRRTSLPCSPAAPVPSPAAAMSCPGLTYACGNQTLEPVLYAAVADSGGCRSKIQSKCLVGGNLVEPSLLDAVTAGKCTPQCPETGPSLPCTVSSEDPLMPSILPSVLPSVRH